MFLEKLFDLLIALWSRITPAEIIDCYEGGVVLRFGVWRRDISPGLCWKWPIIERILTVRTSITTLRLPPQSLTTRDDRPAGISSIIKYSIRDPKPFLLDIDDAIDALADVTAGAVMDTVEASDWKDLIGPSMQKRVIEIVRREVNRYGFQIHAITFADKSRTPSLRLIGVTPVPKDIAN